MPDHGPLGDEALANVLGCVDRAEQGLGACVIPEPDACGGVLGELGWFHVTHRRLVLPEHFHLARERHKGVLRSAPEQL